VLSWADQVVLVLTIISVLLFFAAELIFFRFFSEATVLKGQMLFLSAGALINALLGAYFFLNHIFIPPEARWQDALLCLIIANIIFDLVAFLYVLCIFGPYESSLRLRLLRELGDVYPEGLTREQLFARYNLEDVVQRRLGRLLASQELVLKEGKYALRNPHNFFIVSEKVAIWLRRFYVG